MRRSVPTGLSPAIGAVSFSRSRISAVAMRCSSIDETGAKVCRSPLKTPNPAINTAFLRSEGDPDCHRLFQQCAKSDKVARGIRPKKSGGQSPQTLPEATDKHGTASRWRRSLRHMSCIASLNRLTTNLIAGKKAKIPYSAKLPMSMGKVARLGQPVKLLPAPRTTSSAPLGIANERQIVTAYLRCAPAGIRHASTRKPEA